MKRINEFAELYKRNAHVMVDVVSFEDNRLIVRAEQKDLINRKLLNKMKQGGTVLFLSSIMR